jgi:calcium-dependent protein kinase
LHKNHLVHRDIKPENIVFCNKTELKIKLIDFGTAQKFRPNQFMIQPYGTPYYMAPEVIKACYTEKCDIWSIGVILHILLTNESPFEADTDTGVLKRILEFKTFTFEGQTWKTRSLGAMDLIKRLCFVETKMRPSAEQALEHEWIKNLGAFTVQTSEIKKALLCF